MIIGLGLIGCTSYEPTSDLPEASLQTLPELVETGAFAVGADPYVETERQEALFNADLVARGILAVLILAENRGDRAVFLRRSDVRLRLPSGRSVASGSIDAVASRFQVERASGFWPTFLFGMAGQFASASMARGAEVDRRKDYSAKELEDTTLAPGESVQGFVFFVLARGTEAFDEADLRMRFVEVGKLESEVVTLALHGLAFPQVALEPKNQPGIHWDERKPQEP